MAVCEHLELLKLGTPDWNRWRKENPSVVSDWSAAHLRNVRLSGADLTGANFELTYFGQADLSGADLSDACGIIDPSGLRLTLHVQRQLLAQEAILGRQASTAPETGCDQAGDISEENEDGAAHHKRAMIARINGGSCGLMNSAGPHDLRNRAFFDPHGIFADTRMLLAPGKMSV